MKVLLMQKNACNAFSAVGGVQKKGVLKNFAIFTGKHLCWSLFLIIKLENFRYATLLKKAPTQMLSCGSRTTGKLPPPNPKTNPNLNSNPNPNRGGQFSSGAIVRIPFPCKYCPVFKNFEKHLRATASEIRRGTYEIGSGDIMYYFMTNT